MTKKILLFSICTVVLLSMSSCVTTQNQNKVYVKDYGERMQLLETNFPEIYKLLCDGKVILNEMYEYQDENGTPRVHIDYRYVTPSNYYYKW